MSGLHRTSLTTSQKVECAALALAGQGCHGTVSAVSRQYEVSRPTVYEARAAATRVLTEHFSSEEQAVRVTVDEAQLHRAVVALRAMAPNAIRPIEELLPILYPGMRLSYGSIQSMLVGAEAKAREFNAHADMSGVKAGALDEMFSQGDPVLAGVDLDSGYLFALELRATRSGADWAQVLSQSKAQGVELSVVVKDAAKGIEAGVGEVFPEAEQRDDCFHALYEMNKVRRRLEQSAYGAIAREVEAQQRLPRIRAQETKRRRSQRQKIVWAARQCEQAIARYDRFEAAMSQAREALECVDLERGELRSAEQVRRMVEDAAQAMCAIDTYHCRKVGKYLHNRAPGLALAMGALRPQLDALQHSFPHEGIVAACIVQRLRGELRRRCTRAQRAEKSHHLLAAWAYLNTHFAAHAEKVLDAVASLLEHHHRASSAIEGFNAALRPFLYVHKGVSAGFLELFRARHNLRTRRWGRHQGSSAHQCLTGERVEDWLSVLGYPPSATVH
jgi:hypothetical protein